MTHPQVLKILKMGLNVFLTGPAGSGKTYILQSFINFLKKKRRRVAVTATTGLAATHLNGRTIHAWSGIGVEKELTKQLLDKILKNKGLLEEIEDTEVLIIDEVSALHAYQLDMIDEICRQVRWQEAQKPFGGLQVVLSGDFFQLPPIVKRTQPRTEPQFIIEAQVWQALNPTICYLSEQYRQTKEGDLAEILNALRYNQLQDQHIQALRRRILPNPGNLLELYCHNMDIDRVNHRKLASLTHQDKVFWAEKNDFSTDKKLIQQLIRNCLALEELHLKQGARVIFIKNDPDGKYINGTLGTVVGFNRKNGYPIVVTRHQKTIYTEPAIWKIEKDDQDLASFKQIPLKLAWAITVHKSQGMTLDGAFIDLSKTFTPGMGYVALSRLKDLQSLYLTEFNQLALMINPVVLEIDQVLQDQSRFFISKNIL